MFISDQHGISYWAIIIVVAFMGMALIVAMWPQNDIITSNEMIPSRIRLLQKIKNQANNINEKAKIEKWITNNKLNYYGEDPYTMYDGGTPLFDESTGKTMNRYDYIIKHHPNKPWNE